MSSTGNHAEDIEHDLDHAGREFGEAFADSVAPSGDPEDEALIDTQE